MKIELARNGKSWDEVDSNPDQVRVDYFLVINIFSSRGLLVMCYSIFLVRKTFGSEVV